MWSEGGAESSPFGAKSMNIYESSGSTGSESRWESARHPDGAEFWLRPARTPEIKELHTLISLEIPSAVGPAEVMEELPNPFYRIP